MTTPVVPPNPAAPRRKRPRKSRSILLLLTLGLLIAGSLAFDAVLRRVLAPWSVTMNGRPPMTGEWVGALHLEEGISGALWLDLDVDLGGDEGFNINNVTGNGRYCLGDDRGETGLFGHADRSGHVDDFGFPQDAEDPVMLFHNIAGDWDGESLTLSGTYSYDPTAAHVSYSDRPDTVLNVEMRRGNLDDFSAVCGSR